MIIIKFLIVGFIAIFSTLFFVAAGFAVSEEDKKASKNAFICYMIGLIWLFIAFFTGLK